VHTVTDLEIRPLRPDEIERFVRLSHYSFAGRPLEQRRADFAGRVTPRDVLVAFEGDEIVSQVMIYEFTYWLGGVRYPTGGLANVVTAPEVGRRGYASQMLRATLKYMRDELGQCLCTLYPTVFPLYRGLGWALADDTQHISGPPAAFRPNPLLPTDSGARLVRRAATAADVDRLAPVYETFARERSLYLDRPRWWWEARVLRLIHEQPSWLGLWYGSDGALTGYVVYSFEAGGNTHLHVGEVVALHPAAYRGILTFLAAHNLTNELVLSDGRDVPWRTLVANPQLFQVEAQDQANFMLRIVDFRQAIARRPVTHRAELPPATLNIVDESAPWNHGAWRLAVQDGRWQATPNTESRPDATADVSTVAGLFSGFLTVAEARDAGLLPAHDRAIPTLEALFRTKYPPTSRDHF
jgi:predicted acetyltransferase